MENKSTENLRDSEERLAEAFGYPMPECEDTALYFQLMALQVETLLNPEAKDQLQSLKRIVLLCEVCELILENKVCIVTSFLEAFGHEDQ